MRLRTVLKEVYRRKTLSRTLMNLAIYDHISLSGRVLDIGGKGKPSYHRFLRGLPSCRLIRLDLAGESGEVEVIGSALNLPFKSGSYDIVLCFNVLEPIFDYKQALSEIQRVLKPNGTFYGYVPFLKEIHAAPFDHWRYTKATLERILENAGFQRITIQSYGGLFLIVYELLRPLCKIGLIRIALVLTMLVLNRLSLLVSQELGGEKYVLGYFFIAKNAGSSPR